MVKHQRCFPLVIFFFDSLNLFFWWCMDIVGRKLVLVTLEVLVKDFMDTVDFLVPSQPKSLKSGNVFKYFWIAWVTILRDLFVHLAIPTFKKKLDSPKGVLTGLLLLGLTLDRNIVLYENEKFTKRDSHPWSWSMGLINNYTEMILICGLLFSCESHFFSHKIKGIQFKDFSLGIFL